MNPLFLLVAHKDNIIKKENINNILKILNSKNYIDSSFKIDSLFYESFKELLNLVNSRIQEHNKLNILIFVDLPILSLEEVLILKKKVYLFCTFEDIPEHYHTFYKYIQFLFDGLFIEPGYKSFFAAFGLPTYSQFIFNSDIAYFFKYKKSYRSLVPFNERLYDFSFIGRFDRPGRRSLISQLKKNFQKVYFHDSSNTFIDHKKLNNIIKNTRFFINSTSVQSKNTFGFKNFPEYLQLQEKTRLLEYAANGCIIFSEVMPQNYFTTLNKDFKLPIIEVPRGVNKSEFCFDFIYKNNLDIQKLSKKTYDAAIRAYDADGIKNVFLNVLNDIKYRSSKYSDIKLSKKELDIVKFKYNRFYFNQDIKRILNLNLSFKNKFFKLIMFLKKRYKVYGLIQANVIIINTIYNNIYNKFNKIFYESQN